MVFIGPFCFNIQICFSSVCKRFEEMKEHLCWHFPNHFSFEFGFPNQPVSSAKIYSCLRKAIIHWQTKSITFYSKFVSKCQTEGFSKCNSRIFYGMVFIYFQISFYLYLQIHLSMTRKLIQHMIKKVETCRNIRFSCPI